MKSAPALLVALAVLATVASFAEAWWMSNEKHTYHACGASLEVFIGDTCKGKWYAGCSSDSCRRRRDLDRILATEDRAKNFLKAKRRRRAVWSLYEECCREGCSTEEVREHC